MADPSPPQPIGVFDSGVGGLTVLDALVEALPSERFVYFGDTLHMPYGNRSFEDIATLAEGIWRWLVDVHRVKGVVVACNTSAGVLYPQWQQRPLPVVEPMTPLCRWLAQEAPYATVGLLATPTTVATGRYTQVLGAMNPAIRLLEQPCDGLARMVESGEMESPACRALLEATLTPLLDAGMEALILGCTHYPHAARQIAAVLPPGFPLLDPAQWMREAVAQWAPPVLGTGSVTYYVSGSPQDFEATSRGLRLQHLQVAGVQQAWPHSQTVSAS